MYYQMFNSLTCFSPKSLHCHHGFVNFREVWPERNEFGAPDITPEEEFMSLREIFMANLPSKSKLSTFTERITCNLSQTGKRLLINF